MVSLEHNHAHGSKDAVLSKEVEVIGKAIEDVRILKEKVTGFADEFDKEGGRRMGDIFPSSLAFHWEPRTSYPICRSQ